MPSDCVICLFFHLTMSSQHSKVFIGKQPFFISFICLRRKPLWHGKRLGKLHWKIRTRKFTLNYLVTLNVNVFTGRLEIEIGVWKKNLVCVFFVQIKFLSFVKLSNIQFVSRLTYPKFSHSIFDKLSCLFMSVYERGVLWHFIQDITWRAKSKNQYRVKK